MRCTSLVKSNSIFPFEIKRFRQKTSTNAGFFASMRTVLKSILPHAPTTNETNPLAAPEIARHFAWQPTKNFPTFSKP